MTTLVTADLHLSENPRDGYRFQFLEGLPDLVRRLGARRVVILGDLTEAKDAHRAPLVNRIADSLAKLAEEVSVYILRGNHDYVIAEVPFYRFLSHLRNIRWINQPTVLKLRGLGDCLFLPHTNNLEDWANLAFDEHAWTFCHQTFEGAAAGHGRQLTGVPVPGGAFRVVSGDIHVPQKLSRITYVGAPYHVDFGDDYEPRVLLLDGNKMRSVPCNGPQKRLVEVSSVGDLAPAGGSVRPGDIAKVRVHVSQEELAARSKIRAAVREWADNAKVVLHAVQLVAGEGPKQKKTRQPDRRSDEDLVREYVAARGGGKATLQVGLKLIEREQEK